MRFVFYHFPFPFNLLSYSLHHWLCICHNGLPASSHTGYLLTSGLCSSYFLCLLCSSPRYACLTNSLISSSLLQFQLDFPIWSCYLLLPNIIPKTIPPTLTIPLTLLYFFFFLEYLTIYLLSLLFTAYFSRLDYKQHRGRDYLLHPLMDIPSTRQYLAHNSPSENICWKNETK